MKAKFLVYALPALILATMHVSEAQQPTGKIARIAYLGSDRAPAGMPRENAFFQGLREHGWIEGQNILVERRYWDNRADLLPALADEIVGLKPDIIDRKSV